MPNAPDAAALSQEGLASKHRELRANLVATGVLVRHVASALQNPASLDPAAALIQATIAILDRPGARSREETVREVNLSNAALVAVIDLVKSHADAPKQSRPKPSS